MSEHGEMSRARGVPWKARGCAVFDDTDELVCATVIATDAAFIASRINAHAALIEALREAERFLDYFAEGRMSFVGPGTPKSCLAQVRAALRLAQEPTIDPAGLVSP